MNSKARLNGELLTPEEMAEPMGLGYVSAARRLGLIYLAGADAVAYVLITFANEARRLTADHEAGLLNTEQFNKAFDEAIDRLAQILHGENPRYMATPWFTDPFQLRQHIVDIYADDAREFEDIYARFMADPIREEALMFLTSVAEADTFDNTTASDFILGHAREILNIPDEIPFPHLDVQLRSSETIELMISAETADGQCREVGER